MFTSTIWFRFDLFHFSVFLRFWALFSFCWLPCSTSRLPSLLRAAVRAQMWEGGRPETCQSKTPLRSSPTHTPNYDFYLQKHLKVCVYASVYVCVYKVNTITAHCAPSRQLYIIPICDIFPLAHQFEMTQTWGLKVFVKKF